MKTLFTLIFMAIMIGGWIVQFINSQNHPPAPQRRRRDNEGKDRVQNEIEQFLDEARRSRQGRAALPADDGIEIIEPGPRRPPAERKDREQVWREQSQGRQKRGIQERPRQKKEPKQGQSAQAAAKPKASAQRPAPATATSSVAKHVQEHMAPRVGQSAARELPRAVDAAVQSHLGEFKAEQADSLGQQAYRQTKVKQSSAAADLRKLLRSGDGVRNAVILNEILGAAHYKRKGRRA